MGPTDTKVREGKANLRETYSFLKLRDSGSHGVYANISVNTEQNTTSIRKILTHSWKATGKEITLNIVINQLIGTKGFVLTTRIPSPIVGFKVFLWKQHLFFFF